MPSVSQFLFLFLIPAIVFSADGQPQFIQVASRANSYCNSTCTQLDIPALNNNPAAIVFASQVVENGLNLNPHPIGVHFINKKWSIINLDQSAIPLGSKFNVQYFSTPDPTYQFVHTVSMETLKENNTRSYIDHPGLNKNPDAQLQLIIRLTGSGNNREEVSSRYDTDEGKWYLFTAGKKTLDNGIAFNIVIGANEKPIRTPSSNAILNQTVNPTPASFGKVQLILMTVEKQAGVFFNGESATANKIEIKDYNFEVMTTRDAASGMATGRRQYQPLVVNKIFGPSSLQFFKANYGYENLKTVTIEFYTIDNAGIPSLVNTIKLTGARVAAYKQFTITDPSGGTGPKGLLDEIKLVFQSIEMKDASALIATDNWSGGN